MLAHLAAVRLVMKTKYECIIFDFDGTIADSLGQSIIVYNKLAPVYGYKPITPAELPTAKEMSMREFIRAYHISKLKLPSILKEGKRIIHGKIDKISPFGGIKEVLREIRKTNVVLGIVTSNSKPNVLRFLEVHQLGKFDFVCGAPKLTKKSKSLNAVSRVFTLKSHHIVYIGDEKRDIRAAHSAGTDSIAVSWGFNSENSLAEEKPTFIARQPQDILSLVQEG